MTVQSNAPAPTAVPRISSSVQRAAELLAQHDEVSAAAIVNCLLKLHPEYAHDRARKLHLDEARGVQKPFEHWLRDVRKLYVAKDVPELHGRLVVLGLGMLDHDVGQQLTAGGVIPGIVDELKEPLDRILTPEGRKRWSDLKEIGALAEPDAPESPAEPGKAGLAGGSSAQDVVPTHLDDPATMDELGRKFFAGALARRIRVLRCSQPDSAFLIHLHGEWGAGKSTLLNFLREELERPPESQTAGDHEVERWLVEPWQVVTFNAWQQQRVGTPWWSLMDQVYRSALAVNPWYRAAALWLREQWWRHIAGKTQYLLALALLGLLFWLVTSPGLFGMSAALDPAQKPLDLFAAVMEWLEKLITAVLAVWALCLTVGRALLWGRGRAEQHFIDTTRDPMKRLTDHFTQLVRQIERGGHPLCIFIDDLDRCRESYVVELLEGIQTLFRGAPVTYVIAADRRWLYASFNKVYDALASNVVEPGRPLGYLFLQKIFQLSISVPRIAPTMQSAYWQRLLEDRRPSQPELEQARGEAEQRMQGVRTIEERDAVLNEHMGDSVEDLAMREAAVKRSLMPDMQAGTEHVLRPFAPLLEANPRAMKRLVNAYGVQWDTMLMGGELPTGKLAHELALWTILTLRWPMLAEYLECRPKSVELIGTQHANDLKGLGAGLDRLFQDQDVVAVVCGTADGVDAQLDEAAIRICAGLRPSGSSIGMVA